MCVNVCICLCVCVCKKSMENKGKMYHKPIAYTWTRHENTSVVVT